MRVLRCIAGLASGFIAMTAVGGGVAILAGVDRFPLEWLRGTPFQDYRIPALLLLLVVGGSALMAALAVATRTAVAPSVVALNGLIMMGYITGEVFLLQQVPPGPTRIECIYFALGAALLITGLALTILDQSHSLLGPSRISSYCT